MAWTPNPNRKVVKGIAQVSTKELSEFQNQYGQDKTLRDLLNADKRMIRKTPATTADYETSTPKPVINIQKLADDEAQEALNERTKQVERIKSYPDEDVKANTGESEDWRKRKGGAIKAAKKKSYSNW